MKIKLYSMLFFVIAIIFSSFKLPDDWIRVEQAEKFEIHVENNIVHDGHPVMTIKSIYKDKKSIGALKKEMSVGKYSGKRIRMTGYLKLKNVTGDAGFWLRTDPAIKAPRPLSIDNMRNRAIRGTTGWKKYELVLDVFDNAATITYGAWLSGEGQIWFDENIKFEIVSSNVPVSGINDIVPVIRIYNTPAIVTQTKLDSTRFLTKGHPKLNATYLALNYDFNNIDSVEWIYGEVRVPLGEAPIHTYYSVIGGSGFYSGIQTNSKKERRIIFSVWDASSGNDNKEKVPDSARAVLLTAGKDVFYDRFGNEGSGVHTHYVYDWKEDSTYRFLIHLLPDSIENSTTYALFVEIDNHWKIIAKIKTPEFGGYPKYAYSFLEDFNSKDDEHRRSASFQNTWVRKANGEWKEITQAMFYLPFGDKNRKIKDYGCGLSTSFGFMLSSGGGFTDTYIPTPSYITRPAKDIVPLEVMPE